MITVEFDRPYPPYNAGERATVTEPVATHLAARGIARPVDTPPAAAPEAAVVLAPAVASTAPPAPAKGKKA